MREKVRGDGQGAESLSLSMVQELARPVELNNKRAEPSSTT